VFIAGRKELSVTTVSIDALSRVSVLAVDDDRATLQALPLGPIGDGAA